MFFNVNRSVVAERAFEVPNNPNVRFHNIVGVSLGGGVGTINRLINNTGAPVNAINYPKAFSILHQRSRSCCRSTQ